MENQKVLNTHTYTHTLGSTLSQTDKHTHTVESECGVERVNVYITVYMHIRLLMVIQTEKNWLKTET